MSSRANRGPTEPALMDHLPIAVAFIRGDSTIEMANDLWHRGRHGPDHLGSASRGTCLRDHMRRSPKAHAELSSYIWQGLERVLSGRAPRFELQYEVPGSDPQRWSLLCVTQRPESGAVLALLDTTDHHQTEAALTDLAFRDGLTGLSNRAIILDHLREALARGRRGLETTVVAFIDLNGFKQVNDLHGHHHGDLVLIEAARRLKASIRESDTCGRWGGDEFVLVVGIREPDNSDALTRRLIESFARPFRIQGHELDIGLSIGIAMADPAADTAESLLRRADLAMYDEKRLAKQRPAPHD